jgi:putative transposase
MSYEYRKLTPQERDEIIKQRRQRGYPLHGPPHPFRESGCYLITAANYQHIPVIHTPERRSSFEILLLDAMRKIKGEIVGWVILPNHYHLLIQLETLELVSQALKSLHGSTSRIWNQADGTTGSRRVWYRFSDRMIRSEAHLYKAMNYLHYNPVKHGCVTDVYEWPWSSVWMYFDNYGREWLRENWRKYSPGDMGAGWDDR